MIDTNQQIQSSVGHERGWKERKKNKGNHCILHVTRNSRIVGTYFLPMDLYSRELNTVKQNKTYKKRERERQHNRPLPIDCHLIDYSQKRPSHVK